MNNDLRGPLLVGFVSFFLFLISNYWLTALGLGWSVFIFALFVSRLGKSLPVLELMLLMSTLQWIIGAKMAFYFEFEHFKYYMYVGEEEYMSLAVPAVIIFSVGVLWVAPRQTIKEINDQLVEFVLHNNKFPYYLILLGLLCTYISPYVPAVLKFVFYLLSSFQYVGLALLLFSPSSKSKWIWFLIIMGILTVSSIVKGMFHDLFLWSAIIVSFVVLQRGWGLFLKLGLMVLAFLVAFFVQSVKSQYRIMVSENTDIDKVDLFFELIGDRVENFNTVFADENYIGMMNVRLNQGWIISAVMDNIPRYEPFAGGETILTAIRASIIPRFLDPGKKRAGGKENFRRFTGLPVRDDTSMGTSILGEAYANYGKVGALVFMFIWGIFLAWGFGKLIKYGRRHPLIIVFIPLIFLQVIKAETELVVVLNHFVKSIILVLVFMIFARRVLGWEV